jgi:hypothetical protein
VGVESALAIRTGDGSLPGLRKAIAMQAAARMRMTSGGKT